MAWAVLVGTASRFARDILVQETGRRFLRERGIDLIASDSPGAFLDETPRRRAPPVRARYARPASARDAKTSPSCGPM
jgi:hypothetical protein